MIENLESAYPGIKRTFMDGQEVRRFINLYVDEEDIRFLNGLDTELEDGAEVSIVSTIANT